MRNLLLATIALLWACPAAAKERAEVCVQSLSSYDTWSKKYSVEATILSGAELGAATSDYRSYTSYATYVVIFWDQDEVTIIKMKNSFAPTAIPSDGVDKQGRTWRVSRSSYCF